ncbi:MAG: hypothetical protein FJ398_13805 [Verrucomicrobia bacterium]|nr:hypothetical protein [Verrucomicrobiota bacterium]
MLPTTIDVIRSSLKADPTLSARDRAELLALVRRGPTSPKPEQHQPNGLRVLSRKAVATTIDRSLRFVDRLAAEGVLKKIRLPGRRRAIGFLAEDVERLLAGAPTQKGGV